MILLRDGKKIPIITYEDFLENEQALYDVVKKAVQYAITELGDDIKCCHWFCSYADYNLEQKYGLKKAA